MKKHKVFGVFQGRRGIFTRNLVPKTTVYGETLVRDGREEYRDWDPKRSKLAAAIMKGSPDIGIREGDHVLYLGCASGTTASHVSDIVGKGGFVTGLDAAPRVLRRFVRLCEERANMAPILADASQTDTYADLVTQADVIVQDIAQRDQARIFLQATRRFLKKGGFAVISVKARSIDVAAKPRAVFKKIQRELEGELTIVDTRILEPFEKDHILYVCKKR